MTCTTKHTKYQPTDEEWKCPKCGAPSGDFYIDESASEEASECPKLHDLDFLRCANCGHTDDGKPFAVRIQKQKALVPCPHCKGSGMVKRSTPGAEGSGGDE